MALQRIGGNRGPIHKWEGTAPGTTFTGLFVGTRKGKNFGPGSKNLYVIKQDSGVEIDLANATVLESAFDEGEVRSGERVQVEYLGKATPAKGGKQYHNFEVMVDREGEIVPRAATTATPTSAPSAPAPQDSNPKVARLRAKVGGGTDAMVAFLEKQHGKDTPAFEAALDSILGTYGA